MGFLKEKSVHDICLWPSFLLIFFLGMGAGRTGDTVVSSFPPLYWFCSVWNCSIFVFILAVPPCPRPSSLSPPHPAARVTFSQWGSGLSFPNLKPSRGFHTLEDQAQTHCDCRSLLDLAPNPERRKGGKDEGMEGRKGCVASHLLPKFSKWICWRRLVRTKLL